MASLAVEFSVQCCPEVVTVCGAPIGTESCIASSLLGRASTVVDRITKLVNLPLARQFQFSLLRASFSPKMVHLQRSLLWHQVTPSTCQVEQAIIEAISTMFRLPIAMDQMALDTRQAWFWNKQCCPLGTVALVCR